MTVKVCMTNDYVQVCYCRPYSGSYETSHTFGVGTYPIAMDYVKCTGSEAKLWDCLHFTHSYSGCDHSHDVGVRCQEGKNVSTKHYVIIIFDPSSAM